LSKGQLLEALERTLPAWHQRTLKALGLETQLNADHSSPSWDRFVHDLLDAPPDSPGFRTAQDVVRFVARWAGVPEKLLGAQPLALKLGDLQFPKGFSPDAMLKAFRVEFLPQVVSAEQRSEQLTRNFEFSYKRRNLRQTFTISLLTAVFLNLPVERLYRRATAVPPGEAMAIAERTMALYQQQRGATPADSLTRQRIEHVANQALAAAGAGDQHVDYAISVSRLRELWAEGKGWALFRFLAGCLMTALLTSFGAPFWNDIAGTLQRLQKGAPPPAKPTEAEA